MPSRAFASAVALLASASSALAHHPMGGAPQTFAHGLLSGLAHPVIGLDHLAFVLAAGVLAAPLKRGPLMPLAFLAAGALGSALHLGGLALPGAEVGVALSVVALGALVLAGRSMGTAGVGALFAAAGLFHGHALAESVVGAEPAPLGAYLLGLVAVQYTLTLAALYGTRRLAGRSALARPVLATAGLATVAIGLSFVLRGIAG